MQRRLRESKSRTKLILGEGLESAAVEGSLHQQTESILVSCPVTIEPVVLESSSMGLIAREERRSQV